MNFPLNHGQLDELAHNTGAAAVPTTTFNDPSRRMFVLSGMKGTEVSPYRSVLYDAASELFDIIRADPRVQAAGGKSVQILDHDRVTERPYGKIPKIGYAKPSDWHPALRVLLHSLANMASAPTMKQQDGTLSRRDFLNVPWGTDTIKPLADKTGIVGAKFKQAIVSLAHMGWLELFPSDGDGHFPYIKPSPEFLDWMTEKGLVFAGHPYPRRRAKELPAADLLRVNPGNGEDIQNLTRPLDADEEILPAVNATLRQQRLKLHFPDYRTYRDAYDDEAGRLSFRVNGDKDLYRVFSGEDGRGGRLYGHWVQGVPASLRKTLTINDRPTVELDFGAMQLALLYSVAGINLPEMEDLYAVPGQSRDDMKLVLTRTVGTAASAKAISAIAQALYEDGRKRSGLAKELYAAFWDHHAGVNPHGQGDTEPWAELQTLDSRLALRILRRLHDSGITAIPIHDSFIVEARFEDHLRQVMIEEFEALTGLSGVAVRRA